VTPRPNSVDISSPRLIAQLRDGDSTAFESVFHDYYAKLCGFAYGFTKNAATAEEIVQDVFGALWERRRELRITSSLRAYLYAAVRNRALNLLKHDSIVDEWERDESAEDTRLLHAPPPQPDELFDRAQLEAQLAAALEALPKRCALVMRLRWREQMSHAEIAEAMGISAKGVEKQLERGLQALRARLR
jgi:RNA polymerase sigma-70 factor (ECF subfamily)